MWIEERESGEREREREREKEREREREREKKEEEKTHCCTKKKNISQKSAQTKQTSRCGDPFKKKEQR